MFPLSSLLGSAWLPLETVTKSIEKLCSPDPYSRSTNEGGVRVKKTDMGYEIVNYTTYRTLSLRNAEAERKRLYREELKKSGQTSGVVRTSSDASKNVPGCPDPSASASSSFSSSFLKWWEQYPRKLGKIDASKAYEQVMSSGAKEKDLLLALKAYCVDLRNKGTEEKFIKHPATFLRAERWKDYLNMPTERPIQIGETRERTRSDAYWAEVRRLKGLGLEGKELERSLTTWVAEQQPSEEKP